MKITALILTVVFAIAALSIPVHACGGASEEINPKVLVKNAEIIVRATAVGFVDPPKDSSWVALIEFRVEEVLKGEGVPGVFYFKGLLNDKDDYNDRPVPYDYVRPMGRGGSCSARHYKQGAEFLLFLQRHVDEDSREWGDVTPYWASMAATNEQLRSPDDAWLIWVRDYLKRSNSKMKEVSLYWPNETPKMSFGLSACREFFNSHFIFYIVNNRRARTTRPWAVHL